MRLLLHICCANCAILPLEELKDRFELILFWYNPNIFPQQEYEKRLTDVYRLAEIYQLPLLVDDYENEKWFNLVKGLENEPESGQRCESCFKMRLGRTASKAQENNFHFFTTSLGISRYKNTQLINQIGQELAKKHKAKYYQLEIDKNKASQRELEMSRKYKFYRQKYCGCKLSIRI